MVSKGAWELAQTPRVFVNYRHSRSLETIYFVWCSIDQGIQKTAVLSAVSAGRLRGLGWFVDQLEG